MNLIADLWRIGDCRTILAARLSGVNPSFFLLAFNVGNGLQVTSHSSVIHFVVVSGSLLLKLFGMLASYRSTIGQLGKQSEAGALEIHVACNGVD